MKTPTFRQLIEEITRAGVREGKKPLTITSIVKRCRVKRAHFYNMLTGNCGVSDKFVEKVAKGLGLELELVKSSVEKQRAIAEMTK